MALEVPSWMQPTPVLKVLQASTEAEQSDQQIRNQRQSLELRNQQAADRLQMAYESLQERERVADQNNARMLSIAQQNMDMRRELADLVNTRIRGVEEMRDTRARDLADAANELKQNRLDLDKQKLESSEKWKADTSDFRWSSLTERGTQKPKYVHEVGSGIWLFDADNPQGKKVVDLGGRKLMPEDQNKVNLIDAQIKSYQKLAESNPLNANDYDMKIQALMGTLAEIYGKHSERTGAASLRPPLPQSSPTKSGGPAWRISSQQEYDELPDGSEYIGKDGRRYRKPSSDER